MTEASSVRRVVARGIFGGACAAVLGLTALAASPVLAQSSVPYIENVFEDEPQRRQMQEEPQQYAPPRAPYPTSQGLQAPIDPSAQYAKPGEATPAVARLMVRVDQLESELARLTGEYERMQFRYDRLNTMVTQLMKAQGGAPSSQPMMNSSEPPSALQGSSPFGMVNGAADAADEMVPGSVSQGSPFGMAPQSGPLSAPAPIALQQPTGDPEIDFKAARNLLLKGEFELAENAFRRYTAMYPTSDNAGEAQYWIGESLYVRELYSDAAEAYLTTVRDYPQSPRAADSLLKLAYAMNQLGERAKACKSLGKLSRDYPNASEPVMRSLRKARLDFSCS